MDHVDAICKNFLYFMILHLFTIRHHGVFKRLDFKFDLILCISTIRFKNFDGLNHLLESFNWLRSSSDQTDEVHLIEGTSIVGVDIAFHLFHFG